MTDYRQLRCRQGAIQEQPPTKDLRCYRPHHALPFVDIIAVLGLEARGVDRVVVEEKGNGSPWNEMYREPHHEWS